MPLISFTLFLLPLSFFSHSPSSFTLSFDLLRRDLATGTLDGPRSFGRPRPMNTTAFGHATRTLGRALIVMDTDADGQATRNLDGTSTSGSQVDTMDGYYGIFSSATGTSYRTSARQPRPFTTHTTSPRARPLRPPPSRRTKLTNVLNTSNIKLSVNTRTSTRNRTTKNQYFSLTRFHSVVSGRRNSLSVVANRFLWSLSFWCSKSQIAFQWYTNPCSLVAPFNPFIKKQYKSS